MTVRAGSNEVRVGYPPNRWGRRAFERDRRAGRLAWLDELARVRVPELAPRPVRAGWLRWLLAAWALVAAFAAVGSLNVSPDHRAVPEFRKLTPRQRFLLAWGFEKVGGGANVYYVSAAGSDANAGTFAAPWATVSKVSGFAFASGDIVQFRQGDTFTISGSTGIYSSHLAGVTFRSYDPSTGNPSVVGTRATLRGTSFTQVFGTGTNTNNVTIDNLVLTTGGDPTNVPSGVGYSLISNDAGTSCNSWTIKNCVMSNAGGSAIRLQGNGATSASTGWLISNCTLHDTGDSVILFNHCGGGHEITGSTIYHASMNTALPTFAHGIYGAAKNLNIHDNEFYACGSNGQCISIREDGAMVYRNNIHDTPFALGFFDYSYTSTGAVCWYDNNLWNIGSGGSGWAVYATVDWLANPNMAGHTYGDYLGPSTMELVVCRNIVVMTGGSEAIALYYDTTHSAAHTQTVEIANNILSGPATYLIHGATPAAAHSWIEKNNRFYNWGTGWNWNGTAYTSLAAWTSAAAGSGGTVVKGTGSSTGNPLLGAAPALTPGDATLVDAGTSLVSSALTFTKVA